MRDVKWMLVAALGAAGCNQIFGLKATSIQDADVSNELGIDSSTVFYVPISWRIVDGAAGATAATVSDLKLAYDPKPKIAKGTDPLVDAPYRGDGTIAVPNDFASADWRLAFHSDVDDLDHEYQWHAGTSAHAVTRIGTGNASPMPVTSGSTYNMALTGAPYTHYTVATTGVWTEYTVIGSPAANASFDYDFSAVPTLGTEPAVGPFGKPTSARGDLQLFIPRPPKSGSCMAAPAVGTQSVDLTDGATATSAIAWTATTSDWGAIAIKGSPTLSRFKALGTPRQGAESDLLTYGYLPKYSMPSFNRRHTPDVGIHVQTEHPTFISLDECPTPGTTSQPVVDPPALATSTALAKGLYLELTNVRMLGSASLMSTIQAVSDAPDQITLAAPLPLQVTLDGTSLEASGDYTWSQTPSSKQIALVWGYETGQQGVAAAPDAVDVILARVPSGGNVVVPLRVYHAVSSPIRIDTAVFGVTSTSANFVFEIRTRKGVPNAAQGDFATTTYPYAETRVFTLAFTVKP